METSRMFVCGAALQGGDPKLYPVADSPLAWFPMRVTYNRELRAKASFDRLGIENFIPMRYELVMVGGERRRRLVPGIHNLIFVRSTRSHLSVLKHTDESLLPLRYIMRRSVSTSAAPEILTVPDREMDNFIRVCTAGTDIEYLRYDPFLDKPGQRVRIIEGPFAGVEGIVKRIRKNKQIVVVLPGLAAVMLNSIPYTWVEKI